MARIYTDKTRPKPYEVRWSWYDADGRRHSRKQRFLHKKSADAKFREVSADPDYDPTGGKEAFSVWAERYVESKEGTIKDSSLSKINGILRTSVLPEFGGRRVDSIKTADVKAFTDRLRKERGLTPATVRHHFLVLSGVLGHATNGRAIAINPARGVKLPTDNTVGRIKPEAQFLSPTEVAALSDALAAREPVYGLLVTFIAYTGLRVSEVSGLNIEDIDTMRGAVMVRRTRTKVRGGWVEHTPKNGEPRKVRLAPWLSLLLGEYIGQHPRRHEPKLAPLWPGRKVNDVARFQQAVGGLDWARAWDRDAFYKRHFKPALAEAGLAPTTRLHDLRHTCASILRQSGMPIEHISKTLGHKSVVVTQTIYTHLWDEDTENFMNAVAAPPTLGGRVTLLG